MGRPPLQQPKYKCTCCGIEYDNAKKHFYTSFSPMYNDIGRLDVCNTCVQKIYSELVKKYDSEYDALRRTCMMFDLCFNEKLFQLSEKRNLNSNRMGIYMSKYNMQQYQMRGKTFEDTLEEEKNQKAVEAVQDQYDVEVDVDEDTGQVDLSLLKKKWGIGYSPEEYLALEDHYKMLSSKLDDDDIVQQQLIMDLCDIKTQEVRCRTKGDIKGVKELKQLYQSTLGTANLKPKDTKTALNDPDECWGVFNEMIEHYSPSEFYADKTLFKDYEGMGEYLERFVTRPLENFIIDKHQMDEEYVVNVDDTE